MDAHEITDFAKGLVESKNVNDIFDCVDKVIDERKETTLDMFYLILIRLQEDDIHCNGHYYSLQKNLSKYDRRFYADYYLETEFVQDLSRIFEKIMINGNIKLNENNILDFLRYNFIVPNIENYDVERCIGMDDLAQFNFNFYFLWEYSEDSEYYLMDPYLRKILKVEEVEALDFYYFCWENIKNPQMIIEYIKDNNPHLSKEIYKLIFKYSRDTDLINFFNKKEQFDDFYSGHYQTTFDTEYIVKYDKILDQTRTLMEKY